MRRLSGPGLILYAITATLAAIDWIMALEPGWYSTIIGLLFISGQVLTALAFAIVALLILARHSRLAAVLRADHLHDLGKLLLVFVMVWAYLAFSQLLIIWAENLPEEIPYYLHRLSGGWLWLGVLLVAFHFAIPFFLLLSRQVKRSARALTILAVLIIVMRGADLAWQTLPSFHPGLLRIHWMDIVAPLGLGGLWVAYFSRSLERYPLLPLGALHQKQESDNKT
jgi:hypothetical protein